METKIVISKLQSHDVEFNPVHLKKLLKPKFNEDDEDAFPICDNVAGQNYLKKFFFKSNNKIFYYNDGEFYLDSYAEIAKNIPDDLFFKNMVNGKPKNVSCRQYLQSTDFMSINYTPTIDFTKPRIFTETKTIDGVKLDKAYLNMANKANISPEDVIDFDASKYKTEIDIINNHIKTVLCSDNEKAYEYVLNFFACSIVGKKLRKALYIQSSERTGKGVIMDLMHQILGRRMKKTSNVEDILQYTKGLEGTSLLNLDEVPMDSGLDKRAFSDKLKSLITERTFDCRKMHQNAYTQVNTFNIIITTNNDAIVLSQTNNSRYLCLDVDEYRKGDTAYFKRLTKCISSKNVQKAYVAFMLERFENLKEWNEDEIPMTETKKVKMIEALPVLYKWIKETYVLNNEGIDIGTGLFYEKYFNETKDRTSKNKIGKYLKKIGIVPINVKKNGCSHTTIK